MDWGWLNVFKRAEFNTLMFAFASAGWILFLIYPDIIYFLACAIVCSVYCFARLLSFIWRKSRYDKQMKETKRKEKEAPKNRAIELERQAQFVYDSLSSDNQQILCNIVRNGKKSSYSNVYIFKDENANLYLINLLNNLRYSNVLIDEWLEVTESNSSIIVRIKSPLNEIILEHKE